MPGTKNRSGRRSIITTAAEALGENKENVPAYLARLREIALNTKAPPRDRVDCCRYLIDRAVGKPKGDVSVSSHRILHLTGEQWARYCNAIESQKAEDKVILAPHVPKLLSEVNSQELTRSPSALSVDSQSQEPQQA